MQEFNFSKVYMEQDKERSWQFTAATAHTDTTCASYAHVRMAPYHAYA
jgi:hypothetical protein